LGPPLTKLIFWMKRSEVILPAQSPSGMGFFPFRPSRAEVFRWYCGYGPKVLSQTLFTALRALPDPKSVDFPPSFEPITFPLLPLGFNRLFAPPTWRRSRYRSCLSCSPPRPLLSHLLFFHPFNLLFFFFFAVRCFGAALPQGETLLSLVPSRNFSFISRVHGPDGILRASTSLSNGLFLFSSTHFSEGTIINFETVLVTLPSPPLAEFRGQCALVLPLL